MEMTGQHFPTGAGIRKRKRKREGFGRIKRFAPRPSVIRVSIFFWVIFHVVTRHFLTIKDSEIWVGRGLSWEPFHHHFPKIVFLRPSSSPFLASSLFRSLPTDNVPKPIGRPEFYDSFSILFFPPRFLFDSFRFVDRIIGDNETSIQRFCVDSMNRRIVGGLGQYIYGGKCG